MRIDQKSRRLASLAFAAAAAALLAGCNDQTAGGAKALRPIPSETLALMASKGTTRSAPVLFRAFKHEAELEVWKMKPDGTYAHIKTYPMCRWSGQLGPKLREGDRQVPEGFYTITPGQMNPNSAYYLAFNIGYPNAFDRAHGRTGGDIMVHGDCSSRGCFSMTDKQMSEIYAITREAFAGGQRAIQMHSLPFRMNAENLAKYRFDPHMKFWKDLKKGSDAFEVTKQEPQVAFCGRRYVFNATAEGRMDPGAPCPALNEDESIKSLVAAKEQKDEQKVAELIAKGVKAVRTVYADGGQHPDFKHVDMVSRPEALAEGPREIEIDERGKPLKSPVIQVAAAKMATPVETTAFAPASPVRAAANAATGGVSSESKAAPKAEPAAAQAQPAAAPSAQPFYKKWLPSFGLSGGAKPAEVQPAAATAPAGTQTRPQPKPQAGQTGKKDEKQRVSQAQPPLPDLMRGAAQPLPPGFRSYAPL